jgi:hypothetical protein
VKNIGELLIEEKHLGKLFVRGIFILDLNKTKKF